MRLNTGDGHTLAAYRPQKGHLTNVPSVESRVAALEAIVEQISHRLNTIDNRFTNIENRINSNFKWLVGLLTTVLIANIGTAVTIILTLSKS